MQRRVSLPFCATCGMCGVDAKRLPENWMTQTRRRTTGHAQLQVVRTNGDDELGQLHGVWFCVEGCIDDAEEDASVSAASYGRALRAAASFSGVAVVHEFVTKNLAETILSYFEAREWKPSQSGRRKQDFGPGVNFRRQKVKIEKFKGLPFAVRPVLEKLRRGQGLDQFIDFEAIECGVIEYDPASGAAIDPHFDDTWLWGERIVTLSLGLSTIMTFSREFPGIFGDEDNEGQTETHDYNSGHHRTTPPKEGKKRRRPGSDIPEKESPSLNNEPHDVGKCPPVVEVRVSLPRRSILLMRGAARHIWKHGIKREDIFCQKSDDGDESASRREHQKLLNDSSKSYRRRVSVTFRELAPAFLPGGPNENEGNLLLERAKLNPDVPQAPGTHQTQQPTACSVEAGGGFVDGIQEKA